MYDHQEGCMLIGIWIYPTSQPSSKSELQKLIKKQIFLFLMRALYFPRKIKFIQITSCPSEWNYNV